MCPLVHANEKKQRAQRDRSDRIRGHAMNFAGHAFRRDDCNAGRKLPAGKTKFGWSGRLRRHVRIFEDIIPDAATHFCANSRVQYALILGRSTRQK